MNMTSTGEHLNPLLQAALKYRAEGFSVIPLLPRNKRPAVEWACYQSVLASEDEIRAWWEALPDANVGAIMGSISGGVVVVDIDKRNGGLESMQQLFLPGTRVHATGGDGFHYFYRIRKLVKKAQGIRPGIDIIGEGAYCVMPPSTHSSGKVYAVHTEADILELTDLPIAHSDVLCKEADSETIRIGRRHHSIKTSLRGYANSTMSFIHLWKRATGLVMKRVETSSLAPFTITELFGICLWAWNEAHPRDQFRDTVAWKMLEGRSRQRKDIFWGTPTTPIPSLHPK